MMNVLRMLPTWAWILLVAFASIVYLATRLAIVEENRELITTERDIANAKVTSIGNTLRLQRQITDDINRVSDDAKAQTEYVTAAVVIADGHARSLQQQITELITKRKSCSAEVASGSKAGAGLTVLLADLRKSADETAGRLAAALDRSRIAGFACEAAYSAVLNGE